MEEMPGYRLPSGESDASRNDCTVPRMQPDVVMAEASDQQAIDADLLRLLERQRVPGPVLEL